MAPDSRLDDEMHRFEEQLRRNPGSLVFARLADACRRAGDYERALGLLDEGLARHPQYVSAHIVRARVYEALGRRDQATQAFEHVLELDDQNLVALRSLAELALTAGNVGLARQRYERLLAVDPRNPGVRSIVDRLGRTDAIGNESQGRSRGASATDDLLPVAHPGSVEMDSEEDLRAWISAEAEQKQNEELRDAASGSARAPAVAPSVAPTGDAALLAAEDDGDLLTQTMAELYTSQGLFEEAAEIYEELLKERPDDESLKQRLASVRASHSGPTLEARRGPSSEASDSPPQAPEASDSPPQAPEASDSSPQAPEASDSSPNEEVPLSPVVAAWLRRMRE